MSDVNEAGMGWAEPQSNRSNGALRQTNLLRTVADTVVRYTTADSPEEIVPAMLGMLGSALGVERILVIKLPEGGKGSAIAHFQWTAPGVSRIDPAVLARFPTSDPKIATWLAPLKRGDHVVVTRATANPTVSQILQTLQLQSILLMPIFVEESLWGQLAFDSSDTCHHWDQSELDTLRLLARLVGGIIQRGGRRELLNRMRESLAFSNVLLKCMVESSPDGILVVDQNTKIVSANHRFREMWHIPEGLIETGAAEPVLQAAVALLEDSDLHVARARHLQAHPEESKHDDLELKDGRTFDRRIESLYADGHYLGRVWFFRDITDRRTAEKQIARLAETDSLTGLANRAAFVERLEHALAARRRDRTAFAVLYCDLDRFKDVNDTLGHPVGDMLLRQVAGRLQSTIRENDVAARFGGDEFAVLQTNVSEATSVGLFAQRLLTALSRPYSVDHQEIRITVSIGIALAGNARDAATILLNADLALYSAKEEGRNTYRFHTGGMDRAVHRRVTIAEELRIGIADGQMEVHYQPQVDTSDGVIKGIEALVRWRHPRRGLLKPDAFLGVAEITGLIGPLNLWVMTQACSRMRSWIDAGIAPALLAVNISPVEFKTPRLETEINQALKKSGLAADRLEIEITEGAMMEVSVREDGVLARLRKRGIRISIDDFGTGYSSLACMKRFRPDRIKVAAEFVRGMLANEADRAVVRAIVDLAHQLRVAVIAEGVESQGQARFLSGLGCHDVQGFAYGRPVPAEQLTKVLLEGTRLAQIRPARSAKARRTRHVPLGAPRHASDPAPSKDQDW